MINNAKEIFDQNIESIITLRQIFNFFDSKVPAFDTSEILRAEFVLLVSAFDTFIHDIVREGMINIFDGTKEDSAHFNNFKISLKTVKLLLEVEHPERSNLLSAEIRKITTKDSYQSPSSIEKAMLLISLKKIWTKIGSHFENTPEEIKKKLAIIVNRRNKMAHEADINQLTGEKNPITRVEIDETLRFIIKIVEAIIEELKKTDNNG